ncbi:hypothetical protein PIROE2DRAFT_23188, partial [Piromyces sp. E2]
GITPLISVCVNDDFDVIKMLVDQGADVNKESLYGFTPLINACKNNNFDIVEYLVENGAD